MPRPGSSRPPVSVIVPFKGDEADARRLAQSLRSIATRSGDELIVADNTAAGVRALAALPPPVRVLRVTGESSSYHARNVAAEAACASWLLFVDADCAPAGAGLLDAYFDDPVDERCGLLAGRVSGAPGQRALVARFARARRHFDQEVSLAHAYRPYGVTANLLVRRSVWEQMGGFCEGIRSAGDQDFCWRAHEAGWGIEYRAGAAVEHHHRERIGELARQFARYGAGTAWLRRRHPASPSRRPRLLRRTAGSLVGCARAARAGDPDEARFRLLDLVVVWAGNVGHLLENRPPGAASRAGEHLQRAVLARRFPDPADQGLAEQVAELWRDGVPIGVEAQARPDAPQAATVRARPVAYWEDDGCLRRLAALGWLLVTRPRAALGRPAGGRATSLRTLAPVAQRLHRLGASGLQAGDGMDPVARDLARLLTTSRAHAGE